MTAIVKLYMAGVLGMTVLVSAAAVGVAAPKTKIRWDCKCQCQAVDKNGNMVFGSETHFQTEDPSGCAIGYKVACYVGDLRGNYGYCPTQWKGPAPFGGPGGTGGTRQR